MIHRTFTLFVSATLLLAALTACGALQTGTPTAPNTTTPAATQATSAPAAAGSVPLYPDAKALEGGSTLSTVVDAMKQQIAKQQSAEANVQIDAYTLPSGTSFDQVKKFYGDSLTSGGWSEMASAQQAAAGLPGGGSATWLKDDAHVVMVMTMPDPTQSGNVVLFVTQADKK